MADNRINANHADSTILTGADVLAQYRLLCGVDSTRKVQEASGIATDVSGNLILPASAGYRMKNPAGTFYSELKSGAVTANRSWTLPLVDGSANQVLATNGSLVLFFTTVPGTWEPILDYSVSGAAISNYDFPAVSLTNYYEFRIFADIYNTSGTGNQYQLFFEADYTNTNYYSQIHNSYGTTNSTSRLNENTIGYIESGEYASWDIKNIRRRADGKPWLESIQNRRTAASNIIHSSGLLMKTASVADISAIRFACDTANGIGIGSRLILLGLKK